MTKANAKKKMAKLAAVHMDSNEVDFRVVLDRHDLICICNPGPKGDVITFATEKHGSAFRRYHKTFNKALEYLGSAGE